MGRLVDIEDVIKAVDKHTKDESEVVLDDDISVILEEVQTTYKIEKMIRELNMKLPLYASSWRASMNGIIKKTLET